MSEHEGQPLVAGLVSQSEGDELGKPPGHQPMYMGNLHVSQANVKCASQTFQLGISSNCTSGHRSYGNIRKEQMGMHQGHQSQRCPLPQKEQNI